MKFDFDVIIIGAGAAGLMCAIEAGKRGRSVVVIDHAEKAGKKIAISGGGRCNFTNIHAGSENFLSAQPDFCKSALARYSPHDFIALVEKHGIAYHEKKLGQQFCDGCSQQIIDLLLAECAAARVDIRLNCRVGEIHKRDRFEMETNLGLFQGQTLVIATGGLSFPRLGASDFGYRVARQFSLSLMEPRPGLVPLILPSSDLKIFGPLRGISCETIVSHEGARFRENILFTHRGLSGPAILQISSYWRDGEAIWIDLLPGINAANWLLENRAWRGSLAELLSRRLPLRLAEAWCAGRFSTKPLNTYKNKQLIEIGRALNKWEVTCHASEGYEKAEVTLGGVATSELSSKTMEARKVRGLYFIGEIVDVTGWLGGYNFQWAWASGVAAGKAA